MSDLCNSCNFLVEDEFHCDSRDSNACDACRKLAELDAKYRVIIAELRIERSKLKEEVNRKHSKLIQRFPPEVLSYVFEFCLPEDPMNIEFLGSRAVDTYTICAPLILSHICRWWRSVAHSTPQLWNTILIPLFHEDSSFYERDITDTFPPLPVPIVVEQWLDRAGSLPLSINIFEARDDNCWEPEEEEIIWKTFHKLWLKSPLWKILKFYGDPDNLEFLSCPGKILPQLHTLDLSSSDESINFEINPAGLKTLSIRRISSNVLNFDWSNLTELSMVDQPLSDCLEALRRVPVLSRFIIRELRSFYQPPQSPIILPNITYLEIDSSPLWFLENVTLTSLKTLVLRSRSRDEIHMLFSFLQRSGCSLEQLSLCVTLDRPSLTSLCHDMATLRHLTLDFSEYGFDYSNNIFNLLSMFPTVDSRIVPQYLPYLNSLTLITKHDPDWAMLPRIFGTSHKQTIERHRLSLESISILVKACYRTRNSSRLSYITDPSVDRIDKEHVDKILWIRDFFGVKWRITFGGDNFL
ncbi:hypothetical protein BDN70DRAFT_879835 [Pholiota conissans]|uniref:F-box domain-containing protein n=1 Tax=Pholiota conissans TaxID=109636 RepID=A0A9P5YZZ5_9AGAR|nr:hypothetical protein BDN70DRAFT_879835 [Pholiota conissans]